MRALAIIVALCLASNASAETADRSLGPLIAWPLDEIKPNPLTGADFVFKESGVYTDEVARYQRWPDRATARNVVIAAAAGEPAVAWAGADLELLEDCTDETEGKMGDVIVCPAKPPGRVTLKGGRVFAHLNDAHVTGLFEKGPSGWRALVLHVGNPHADAKVMESLADITPAIAVSAAEPAKLFASTVGDPAALAKTVSDRKDVLLYGSSVGERVVGGETVRQKLIAWGLRMKVRGGMAAGATKTVAWIAANVDVGSGKAKGGYRALAIYERSGSTWRLVQLHFSQPASFFMRY